MNESELTQNINGLYLTESGFLELQSELENLMSVKRPEIANRIRESQEHGEFSEDNNELDEVKFEQAFVESRIGELKIIFSSATKLTTDLIPTEYVGIGSLVKVASVEIDDEFELRLVTPIETDPNRDLVSNESPMGLALYGRKAGETVQFETPDGISRYKILAISK